MGDCAVDGDDKIGEREHGRGVGEVGKLVAEMNEPRGAGKHGCVVLAQIPLHADEGGTLDGPQGFHAGEGD
jgi:hypothetical protein